MNVKQWLLSVCGMLLLAPSSLLTTYYFLDQNGNTNATAVLGNMQYIVTPDDNNPTTQVCTASLVTRRPWSFSH